jgi:hypothetical protein
MATNRIISLQVALGLDAKEFEKTLSQLKQKYETFVKTLPAPQQRQGNTGQESQSKSNDLLKAFNEAIARSNELQKQAIAVANQVSAAQQSANQLKQQAVALAKQADEASAKFNTGEADRVRQVSDAQAALNKVLASQVGFVEQVANAQQSAQQQASQAANLATQTIASVQKELALKEQLATAEQNLAAAQQGAIAAATALESSRLKAAEATANVARSVKGGATEISSALQQLNAAEAEYAASARSAFTANEQLSAIQSEVGKTKRQLAVASVEVAIAQKQETAATEASAQLASSARLAVQKAAELQAQAVQKLAQLQAVEASSSNQNNAALSQSAKLRAEAAQAAQAAVNAQQQLNQAQQQASGVAAAVQQAQQQVAAAAKAVNTQLSEQGSLFERLEQFAGKAGASLGAITFRFNNIVFAAQTLAAGVGGVINAVIGQVAQLEQQIIGIQATLAATNRVFQGGQEVTDPLAKINALKQGTIAAIADIRQKSLELAGVTSDQLIDLFSVVSTNIGQIGGTLQDATRLVGSFAAGLGTLGIPLAQARQEVNSILLGSIDQNSQLAKQLSINNQIIAQEKQKGTLVEFLVGKLSTLEAGQALVAKTFSGVTSNIAEIAQRAQEAFGQRLLEPLVVQLNELYKVLAANQKGFENFAAIAASVVLGVAEKVGAIVGAFTPLLPIIAKLAEGFGGALATGLQVVLSTISALAAPIGLVLNAIAALTKDGFGQFLLQVTGVAIAVNTLLIPAVTAAAGVLATGLVEGLILAANVLKTLSFSAAAESILGFGKALSSVIVSIGLAETELVALGGATAIPGLTGLVGVVASLGGAVLALIPGVNAATASIVGLQLAAGGIVLVLGALAVGFAAYSAAQEITRINTEAAIAAQQKFISSSQVLTDQIQAFNKLRKDGVTLSEEQIQAEKALIGEANKQVSVNTVRIDQLEKQKTQWFQNTDEINKQIAALKAINAELGNTTIASQVLPRIGTAYEQITQKLDAANKAIAAGTGTADQLEKYAKDVIANVKILLDQGTITAEQARKQLSVIAGDDKLQLGTQIEAQKAITEAIKTELERRLENQKAATGKISIDIQTGKIDAIAGEKELTKATLEEIRLRREARLKDEEQQRGKVATEQKATLDELVKQEADAQAKIAQIRARGATTQRDQDIKATEFRIEALKGSSEVAKTLLRQELDANESAIIKSKDVEARGKLEAERTFLIAKSKAAQDAADQELASQQSKLEKLKASKATSNADEIASVEKDLKIIGDKRSQAETDAAKTIEEINRDSRNKQAEEDKQITEAQLKERQNLISKQTEILQQKNKVAADTIRASEQESQKQILELRLKGFESETDLSQKTLKANSDRLGQQIADQKAYIKSLEDLYAANPALTIEESNQRRNTLAEEELKLGDLIVKKGEQQLEQVKLIAQAKIDDLNLQQTAIQRIIELQNSLNAVIKSGLELDKSRADNVAAEADIRLKGIQAVAQLREQTLTEDQKKAEAEANAANQVAIAEEKRRLLKEQLNSLGLNELATAKDLAAAARQQEEIIAGAKARQFEISQRIAAFDKEAQIQSQFNAQKQLEIETQILAIKAKASGDRSLIADAEQAIASTKALGEALQANAEIQRTSFKENQDSQTKLFNKQQELDDYASKQKAADAGVFGLKSAFSKANEEATKLPDNMVKASDAADKLTKGLNTSTDAGKRLQDATSGVGKELDAASQKANALATAAQSAASAIAAATQSRAAQDKVLQDAVNDPALRQKIIEGADPADLIPKKAVGGTVLPQRYLVNEQGQEAYTNYSTGQTSLGLGGNIQTAAKGADGKIGSVGGQTIKQKEAEAAAAGLEGYERAAFLLKAKVKELESNGLINTETSTINGVNRTYKDAANLYSQAASTALGGVVSKYAQLQIAQEEASALTGRAIAGRTADEVRFAAAEYKRNQLVGFASGTRGQPIKSGIAMVGEAGPELINVTPQGTHVLSNSDSAKFVGGFEKGTTNLKDFYQAQNIKAQQDLSLILTDLNRAGNPGWKGSLNPLTASNLVFAMSAVGNVRLVARELSQQLAAGEILTARANLKELARVEGALSSRYGVFNSEVSKAIRAVTTLVNAKPQVPSFASGVTNFSGGIAKVHGGEMLVNMARGTDVIPKASGGEVQGRAIPSGMRPAARGGNFTPQQSQNTVSPSMQNIANTTVTNTMRNDDVVRSLESLKPLLAKRESASKQIIVNRSTDVQGDITAALLALR